MPSPTPVSEGEVVVVFPQKSISSPPPKLTFFSTLPPYAVLNNRPQRGGRRRRAARGQRAAAEASHRGGAFEGERSFTTPRFLFFLLTNEIWVNDNNKPLLIERHQKSRWEVFTQFSTAAATPTTPGMACALSLTSFVFCFPFVPLGVSTPFIHARVASLPYFMRSAMLQK